MNEAWQAGDGGELVVYDKENNQLFELEPLAGRMIFMSEEFPHEVLPTQQKEKVLLAGF